MAMGNLGGGLGTQASPFEIWDVADLDALRGRSTSAASPVFVNFKADIDFAPRTNFDTIRFGNNTSGTNNMDFVHIDGEGHTLLNFRQSGTVATASVGLFRFITGSIRNITVQNCDLRGNVGATRAVLIQNFRVTDPVENIRIFGAMIDTSTVAANNRAGIATLVDTAVSGSPVVFNNCHVGLRVSVSTQFSGFCSRQGGNYTFINCISSCEITVTGSTTNGHCTGFIGLISQAINDTGVYVFDACVSDCTFTCTNATGRFPGVVSGYRTRGSGTTQTGSASTFTNCISRCHFDGEPDSIRTSDIASFAPVGMHRGSISQCYSISTYNLRGSLANIFGGADAVIFDFENSGLPLSRFIDGSEMGLTTNQMQSEAFLTGNRGWVFSQGGWRIDPTGNIWNGYPFIHEFNGFPFSDGVSVSSMSGYLDAGLDSLEVIFFNVVNIFLGDAFVIQILDESNAVLHQQEVSLTTIHSGVNLSISIEYDVLEKLCPGFYKIKAFIRRGLERYLLHMFIFKLFDRVVGVSNLAPCTITKPVTEANNTVQFDYGINTDIRETGAIDATFRIGNYLTKVTNRMIMEVSSTTATGAISLSSMSLNVTTPIRIHSIAHFVRGSTVAAGNSFTITYTINGVQQPPIGPFPGGAGIADQYYELKLPNPILLERGTRTISFSSSTSAIRLFLTTVRPTVPEFVITGTGNIHRMRMEYIPVVHMQGTACIAIDNHIPLGAYPFEAEGSIMVGQERRKFNEITDKVLVVEPGLIDLGNVTQSVSGRVSATRFIGTGTDNAIVTNNITGAMSGDTVSINITKGMDVLYENTDELAESTESYAHAIPGTVFESFESIGDYLIIITIQRGGFIDFRYLTYTTIARPELFAAHLSSALVDLPMISPHPISASWRLVGGTGCTVKGTASVSNILDETACLVKSCDFEALVAESNFTFESIFADISSLRGGLFDVVLFVFVEHDVFGAFKTNVANAKALTVAYPGVPGISQLSLDYPGRYVGAHRDIAVTARLFNIVAGGDQLRYELRDGSHVMHSFTTGNLANMAIMNVHSIPAIYFARMKQGVYTIAVSTLRDGQVRQTESIQYEAVQPPTLHFVSINPNELYLPVDPPEDIEVSLFVNGRGIDRIHGVLEIENTSYHAIVDVSTRKGVE